MSLTRTFRPAIQLIVLAATCGTQLPSMQDPVTLRTETRVVEVDVSVRDSQGKSVGDLRKEDFTIIDDGKPRAFTIFSVNRTTPGSGSTPTPITPALPARPVLQSGTFTNIGEPPPPPEGHSTSSCSTVSTDGSITSAMRVRACSEC